jgi:signal transduction histidine kinase
MATLVSDLADVSRIEAGRIRLDFSAVSLADVIQEVVSSQQGQIDLKGQSLDVRTPPDLPPVWGDLNRVNQILTNLLSNAHKYTPEGGKLAIRAEHSLNRSLNRSPHAGENQGSAEVVLVSVQDSGYGIAPADQGKIFQKFFRSEEAAIRDAPGTGLGLNITRHLVEMQGGHIWFESLPGEGTTFYFTIPVAN